MDVWRARCQSFERWVKQIWNGSVIAQAGS